MSRFNLWFRQNLITPDGRAVWWEHVLFWLPLLAVPGLALSRYVTHTVTPLLMFCSLGLLAGLYSWRQDVAVCRDPLFKPDPAAQNVPLQALVYGAVTLAVLAFAVWMELK